MKLSMQFFGRDRLLTTGVAGTIIAALLCFTPLLIVALGAVGLSAWLGWLDYALLPVLVIFICIAAFALFRRWKAKRQ